METLCGLAVSRLLGRPSSVDSGRPVPGFQVGRPAVRLGPDGPPAGARLPCPLGSLVVDHEGHARSAAAPRQVRQRHSRPRGSFHGRRSPVNGRSRPRPSWSRPSRTDSVARTSPCGFANGDPDALGLEKLHRTALALGQEVSGTLRDVEPEEQRVRSNPNWMPVRIRRGRSAWCIAPGDLADLQRRRRQPFEVARLLAVERRANQPGRRLTCSRRVRARR